MRKRLQKKLGVGPFKEYGFELHAILKEGVDFDVFFDSFIQLIEHNHMLCGGGFGADGETMSFYIQVGVRKEPHSQKRQMVIDWLKKNPYIHSFKMGPITAD